MEIIFYTEIILQYTYVNRCLTGRWFKDICMLLSAKSSLDYEIMQ